MAPARAVFPPHHLADADVSDGELPRAGYAGCKRQHHAGLGRPETYDRLGFDPWMGALNTACIAYPLGQKLSLYSEFDAHLPVNAERPEGMSTEITSALLRFTQDIISKAVA